MSYTTGDDTVSKSEGEPISQLCGVMDTLDLDAPSQTNGEEESLSDTNTVDHSKIDTSIKYVLEDEDDNGDIAIEESSDEEEEEKELPPSLLSRYCKWLCPGKSALVFYYVNLCVQYEDILTEGTTPLFVSSSLLYENSTHMAKNHRHYFWYLFSIVWFNWHCSLFRVLLGLFRSSG